MSLPSTAITQWRSSYKIGIRGIDDDHFILISLLSELEEASRTGLTRDDIARTLSRLASYAKIHFTREERLMRAHGYPHAEDHIKQHHTFISKLSEFQESSQANGAGVGGDMAVYLRKWLVGHISATDRKFGTFLKVRGVY